MIRKVAKRAQRSASVHSNRILLILIDGLVPVFLTPAGRTGLEPMTPTAARPCGTSSIADVSHLLSFTEAWCAHTGLWQSHFPTAQQISPLTDLSWTTSKLSQGTVNTSQEILPKSQCPMGLMRVLYNPDATSFSVFLVSVQPLVTWPCAMANPCHAHIEWGGGLHWATRQHGNSLQLTVIKTLFVFNKRCQHVLGLQRCSSIRAGKIEAWSKESVKSIAAVTVYTHCPLY